MVVILPQFIYFCAWHFSRHRPTAEFEQLIFRVPLTSVQMSRNHAEVVCRHHPCLSPPTQVPQELLDLLLLGSLAWASRTGCSSGALLGNRPSPIFSETLQSWVDEVPEFLSGFLSSPYTYYSGECHLFVAFMGVDGQAVSTIELYIAALRYVWLKLETSNPCPFYSTYMKILLRGIRRAHSMNNPTATV